MRVTGQVADRDGVGDEGRCLYGFVQIVDQVDDRAVRVRLTGLDGNRVGYAPDGNGVVVRRCRRDLSRKPADELGGILHRRQGPRPAPISLVCGQEAECADGGVARDGGQLEIGGGGGEYDPVAVGGVYGCREILDYREVDRTSRGIDLFCVLKRGVDVGHQVCNRSIVVRIGGKHGHAVYSIAGEFLDLEDGIIAEPAVDDVGGVSGGQDRTAQDLVHEVRVDRLEGGGRDQPAATCGQVEPKRYLKTGCGVEHDRRIAADVQQRSEIQVEVYGQIDVEQVVADADVISQNIINGVVVGAGSASDEHAQSRIQHARKALCVGEPGQEGSFHFLHQLVGVGDAADAVIAVVKEEGVFNQVIEVEHVAQVAVHEGGFNGAEQFVLAGVVQPCADLTDQ